MSYTAITFICFSFFQLLRSEGNRPRRYRHGFSFFQLLLAEDNDVVVVALGFSFFQLLPGTYFITSETWRWFQFLSVVTTERKGQRQALHCFSFFQLLQNYFAFRFERSACFSFFQLLQIRTVVVYRFGVGFSFFQLLPDAQGRRAVEGLCFSFFQLLLRRRHLRNRLRIVLVSFSCYRNSTGCPRRQRFQFLSVVTSNPVYVAKVSNSFQFLSVVTTRKT